MPFFVKYLKWFSSLYWCGLLEKHEKEFSLPEAIQLSVVGNLIQSVMFTFPYQSYHFSNFNVLFTKVVTWVFRCCFQFDKLQYNIMAIKNIISIPARLACTFI